MVEFNVLVRDVQEGEGVEQFIPVEIKLERTIEIWKKRADDPKDERAKELLKRVLGASYGIVRNASFHYWVMMACKTYGISPNEWRVMKLKDRGKVIAAIQMENTIMLYERFIEEINRGK